MSTPINAYLTGSFVSDGTALNLELPAEYTDIELINLTDIGSAAAATPVMTAKGTSLMDDGEAIVGLKTNGSATIQIPNTITADGFTFLGDSGDQTLGAALAATAITAANPPVVSLASTAGLSNGDVVRLYGSTGMLQIAGLDFTIGSVVANTSLELSFIDGSGFAAPATAATVQRVPFDSRYYPQRRFITGISQAANAVVTLSVTHGFTAGQSVRMRVPTAFGMSQMDGLLANITAVSTVNNTITLDVDSTAFTAFAFPTSATAGAGVDFAHVAPVGETANEAHANSLDDATNNQSIRGVIVGTGVQTSGATYQWVARRGLTI